MYEIFKTCDKYFLHKKFIESNTYTNINKIRSKYFSESVNIVKTLRNINILYEREIYTSFV